MAHGAQVINCSWGTDEPSQFLHDAIERANKYNDVVVASAGNDGRDLGTQPYYPASFALPNLIAVAATDNFDQLASWSNHSVERVHVAAPSTDILTATRPTTSCRRSRTPEARPRASPITAGISSRPSATACREASPPPYVTFGYDQAGNRSWMEDGPGRVDYTYDALSRMISETRQFDELPGFTYPLTYEYNLANQLTKVTNPAGASFGYNRDLTGQVVCTKCDEEPVFVGTVSTTDDPPREEARWWLWDTAS